jgi:hypothetical protein
MATETKAAYNHLHYKALRADTRRVADYLEDHRPTLNTVKPRAACRDEDPALFFPWGESDPNAGKAEAICQECLVRIECLAWATQGKAVAPEGIWGGRRPEERLYIIEALRNVRRDRTDIRRTA